jgi:hypothetical protein
MNGSNGAGGGRIWMLPLRSNAEYHGRGECCQRQRANPSQRRGRARCNLHRNRIPSGSGVAFHRAQSFTSTSLLGTSVSVTVKGTTAGMLLY